MMHWRKSLLAIHRCKRGGYAIMPLSVIKRDSNTLGPCIILGIIVILGLYLVNINSKITSFVDEWVLNGIFMEFIVVMLLLATFSYILFDNVISSSLFFNGIAITLIVFTPLLKYVNAISLADPHDPLAHYSFALWIVKHGHVAPLEKLYYTSTISGAYAFHPGNGLTPAILHISTGISLDHSMNLVSLLNYIGYVIIILLILSKIIDKKNFFHSDFSSNTTSPFVLFLIVIALTSTIYILPGFWGTFISYLYVGLLLYYILDNVMKLESPSLSKSASIIVLLIVYLGLISTHFSTAFIMTFYFGCLMVVLFLKVKELKMPSTVKVAIVVLVFTFLIYEIFVDVLMLHTTFTEAVQRIASLYLRELKEAEAATERHKYISLIDLVRYFVATKTKLLYIASIMLICLVMSFRTALKTIKHHKAVQTSTIKALVIILLISFVSYIPAYGGVSSFEGFVRVLPLLQVPLIAVIFHFFTVFIQKLSHRLLKNLLSLILVSLIIFGYVSNYNLFPLAPTMRNDEEEYRITGVSPISVYIYDSIRFLAKHGSKTIKFITLSPFVTFGYADLLWNISKIPQHGFISLNPDPDEATKMIEGFINEVKNGIIPLYLTDRLSGRIGLKSYYEKPLKILKSNTSMIYNNRYYALFLSG
jgi:hypothetical protein